MAKLSARKALILAEQNAYKKEKQFQSLLSDRLDSIHYYIQQAARAGGTELRIPYSDSKGSRLMWEVARYFEAEGFKIEMSEGHLVIDWSDEGEHGEA